jgi:hypothetical protein
MHRTLLAALAACLLTQACGGNGGTSGTTGSSTHGTSSSMGGTGGAGGMTSSSSSSGTGGTGGAISCTLAASGPIVTDHDGQVIENVHVVSTNGAAITVNGHKNVIIRNARIEHAGGPGIDVEGADDAVIQDVSIENTAAPPSGENPSEGLINIQCSGSARLSVTRARLTRGSSGAYLLSCPDSTLTFIEGHDFRGPFPRGQLVQWDKSDGGILEDFSVQNPATSWPEDDVNVYQSVGIQIRRGLIDGNNSPSGVGVIFDGDTGLGVVEDVDAIHMGNGCFSDYAGAEGAVFRRTRCRDNICGDQGRGAPLSNGLMWCGHPGYSQIRIETSAYFDACNPGNIVWPADSFAVADVMEQDFTPRAPIALAFCWE